MKKVFIFSILFVTSLYSQNCDINKALNKKVILMINDVDTFKKNSGRSIIAIQNIFSSSTEEKNRKLTNELVVALLNSKKAVASSTIGLVADIKNEKILNENFVKKNPKFEFIKQITVSGFLPDYFLNVILENRCEIYFRLSDAKSGKIVFNK